MGYEIAKSITVTRGKIIIVHASNNVFPHYYQKTEWDATRENFKLLLKDLDSNSVQPIPSANNYKWWFISLEMGKMSFDNEEARLDHFIKMATSRNKGRYIVLNTETNCMLKYEKRYMRGKAAYPTYKQEDASRFNECQARYLQIKYRNHFNAIEQVSK